MINLLPSQEKNTLLLEKNKKLILILGFVFLISLLCFALILLSLYFYMLVQISQQKGVLNDVKKQYQTADFLYYKNVIGHYNGILTKADNFYKKEAYFSGALKIISSILKPDTLHLSAISMESKKENTIQATISGISDSRENLLLFKSNIESNKKITNIYFPPDNWIKPKNINFYFTFEINEKLQ